MKELLQRAGTLGAGFLVVLVLAVFLFGFNRVDEFEVSVKRNPVTGSVAAQPFRQGLYHSILRSWTNFSVRETQYPPQGASERLEALTSDQLQIGLDAAYRYRINPDSAVQIYLTIGEPGQVHAFVYNTYRSALRDAVAEVSAANVLSTERAGIGERINDIMSARLVPRGVEVTDFFVREIEPPAAIRAAIEEKLAREQQVQKEGFQTQVVSEQANQERARAEGIRDAQDIIAASLTGPSGQRYLYWRYLDVLGEVADGQNNMIIAPTEGGVPVFVTPNTN